jgi:hypothetical protein
MLPKANCLAIDDLASQMAGAGMDDDDDEVVSK